MKTVTPSNVKRVLYRHARSFKRGDMVVRFGIASIPIIYSSISHGMSNSSIINATILWMDVGAVGMNNPYILLRSAHWISSSAFAFSPDNAGLT